MIGNIYILEKVEIRIFLNTHKNCVLNVKLQYL